MEEEEEGRRASWSFRRADYINRRVFLRSYPLQWEDEDDMEAGLGGGAARRGVTGKLASKVVGSLKHAVVTVVLHLEEAKVLLLRKLKHKLDFYLLACHPFPFKHSSAGQLLID